LKTPSPSSIQVRLAWFVGLWVVSVLALTLVAAAMRWAMAH